VEGTGSVTGMIGAGGVFLSEEKNYSIQLNKRSFLLVLLTVEILFKKRIAFSLRLSCVGGRPPSGINLFFSKLSTASGRKAYAYCLYVVFNSDFSNCE
jgi:hypothetical protein